MKYPAFLLAPALICAFFLSPADAGKKKKKNNDAPGGDVAGTLVSITKGETAEAATTLTV